jgi:hypothetical protein
VTIFDPEPLCAHCLLTLKLGSLAIAGGLGVIGLLNDFKDKNGNLTTWGRIGLLGLVFSCVVGVATEVTDAHNQAADANRQKAIAEEQTQKVREQLRLANETNGRMEQVLRQSEAVQTTATQTLEKQGQLMKANQIALREIDRGLTPLGSHVALVYELAVSTHNWQFPELKHQLG